MEQEAFAPGAVIAGKYEVLKTIGQGGSGTVYLVMDTNIRKNWATILPIMKNTFSPSA